MNKKKLMLFVVGGILAAIATFLITITVLVVYFYFYISPYLTLEAQSVLYDLRDVEVAQWHYCNDTGGYASTWEELREPNSDRDVRDKPYLNNDFFAEKLGYKYILKSAGESLTGKNGNTVYTDYICIAEPIKFKKGSNRSFYIDSSGVVR